MNIAGLRSASQKNHPMSKLDRILLQATATFLRRLRQRLLIIILIAVVPVLGLILFQAKIARDTQIDEARETAWQIVENVALRESRFIDAAEQLLALLAETPDVTGADKGSCSRFLRHFIERNKVYADLGIADADGRVVCRAELPSADDNIGATSYFQRAAKAKSFAIGDYQVQGAAPRQTMNFGYPIVDEQGRWSRMLFAALDVGWINQLAAGHALPAGVELSIVDSKGTLLARFPEPEKWVGKHIPDAPLFEMLQLRSNSERELVGLDGVDRIYALKPVSWRTGVGQVYVMTGIAKAAAFEQANRILARNLTWLAAVSLLAISLAWLVGSKIVVGYVRDRAAAEESRLHLAAIVESSQDAIIGMTLDGVLTSWNEGAQMMYGFPRDEIVGQPVHRLIPETHQGEVAELLALVKRDLGVNRYESKRVRKDGTIFDVSASLSPIRDLQGQVIGAATIMRDITLARRSEEQLLAYTDRLEMINQISQEIAGTLSVSNVIERSLRGLTSASGFDIALARSLQHGEESFYGVGAASESPAELKRIWTELGAEFEQCFWQCRNPWFVENLAETPEFASASATSRVRSLAVLPFAHGASLSAAVVLLSSQVHPFGSEEQQFLQALSRQIGLAVENARLYGATLAANENLRREIEDRTRAEKMLADFTAMVAHDLRSPMSNIVSISDSIHDGLFGPVNEMQKKWLCKVQESCRGLIAHVSDFLDLSKIDAGKLQLARGPADLGELLRESALAYSVEAEKRKIQLKTEIAADLPALSIDSRRINQVLDNLLSNAFKFTGGGETIEVAARAWGDAEVVFWVKDGGIGIESDELELIFDMYRQARGGQGSPQKSTGLGLAICKKIIEAHGGKIWAESKPDEGSTFYVSLPRNSDSQTYAEPS